jgi:hypothetical protein
MILPQLEQGTHGVEVVGMFFFDDNTSCCERAIPWASASGGWPPSTECCSCFVTGARQLERCLAEGEIGAALPTGPVAGVRGGCFTDTRPWRATRRTT